MAPITQTSRYRDTIISRDHVEALIAEGRRVVMVEGRVLKADAWLPYHPGGDKAILHMVGRDATNEVRAFHSAETQQFMQRYQIGRIEGPWRDLVPPIQGGRFRTKEEQEVPVNRNVLMEEEQHDSSEEERSEEPSPVFDTAEHRTAALRRGRGSSSESSATSLETLELDGPTFSPKNPASGNDRTQQELDHDLSLFPSLDPHTQTTIIQKYRALDSRITAAGLYDCNYTAYLIEFLRYTALALLSLYFLRAQSFTLSAIFLGLLWHQLVFTVHDAGHMGITHNFHIDSCIGIFIADFLGGLSCCWWKRNHNVHHLVTNSAEHDPDIQHMPFFAITPTFLKSLRSTYYDRIMHFDSLAKFLLKYQHYLYYPILTFGRFNLYRLSWQYIFLGQGPRKGPAWWHRHLEICGQIFFWYWFGYLVLYKSIPTLSSRVLFIMVSHMITTPVHVQITLSHFAMSTSDLGVAESFPQRMIRTTMDVDCPAWLDWVHGGLQFQAVHHLFPRVPRHNLRLCQGMVREFCEEVGIPYAIFGFGVGNGMVLGRLGEVARQVRILGRCAGGMGVRDVLER